MQAANNNRYKGIAFKYTRRNKKSANAIASAQKVPKPSNVLKPLKGAWGARVAAKASADTRKNNANANKNKKKPANRFLGKPPRHTSRRFGRMPNSMEEYPPVYYGPRNGPKPKGELFLDALRKRSEKVPTSEELKALREMTFGKVFPKPYRVLEQMTADEGMEWIQRQPDEEVDKILKYF